MLLENFYKIIHRKEREDGLCSVCPIEFLTVSVDAAGELL